MQSETSLKKYQFIIESLQSMLAKGTTTTGQDFFDSTTKELANILEADFVFVGKLANSEQNSVITLSLCANSQIVDNIEYSLKDTPCANVIGQKVCCFPSHVADLFPNDHLLDEMGVEAYLGVPLFDSNQKRQGIIVALYQQPLADTDLQTMVMQLFSNRISNEIERQSMDQEIIEGKAQYQSVVDDMLDYISLFSEDGKFIFANSSLTKLINISEKETYQHSFFDFFDDKTKQELKKNLSAITLDNPTFWIEHKKIQADGSLRWIQWLTRGIFNSKGDLTHYQGVGRDITDLLKAEEEKTKLEIKLSHHEKISAIGQLAGGIAHDFNNQLTAIKGYAELLLLKTNDEHLKRYTNNILLATKNSADLTSQLLAFARKGKFLMTGIDVHSLINEVVELLKHTIDKRIKITSNFMSKKASIKGDPSQIQNVLMNLLLNSRDALPEGGEISIITEDIFLSEDDCNNNFQELTTGHYIQISVNDNGCGIKLDIQRKIFEPFFTTKESGKGTGMGLAAVYGTITNHSGSVSLYSEVNQGTSIKILLPFCITDDKPVEQIEQKANISKNRILIIDDEELVLNVTSQLLTEIGHKVRAFNNARKAIEYYRNNWQDIDLVLIDMIMPELSGKDAFLQMKAINPNLIAILCSGFSINGEAQGIIEEGVNSFIQKPFSLKNLSEEITKSLLH